MAMNVPKTEDEQRAMLASTQNADLLQLISDPSETVIRECLAIDGNAIRHLNRPTLDLQQLAVQTTPFAIEYCSPQKRLKVGPVHASIQRQAFDADPLTLVYAPECFDESLDRHTKPGIRDFAQQIIEGMVELLGDAPLSDEDRDNIRFALKSYAKQGSSGAYVPVWSWYKAHYPKDKATWKAIEGVTKVHAYRVLLADIYKRTTKLVLEAATPLFEAGVPFASLRETLMASTQNDIEAHELPPL